MRRINYIFLFLGGFVVLCLVFAAIILFTFDNEDYRRFVIRGVKYFTGYAMTVEGSFGIELSTEPSLSAEAIRINAGADGSPPPVTRIGKLRIQIALKPLLRGMLVVRELVAEDVVMAVVIEEKAEDDRGSARKVPPDIEIPVLESVRLRNIQLDVIDKAANRTVKIRLRQFDIDDIRDSGPLFVKGEGSVNGHEFKVDGQLGALAAMLRGAQPYPLAFDLHSTGFKLSVSGTVEDFVDGEGLQLRLSAGGGELSNLFQLLQMQVPPLGELKLEATVTRDLSGPEISDINLRLSGDHQVEFAVNGSIANAISGEGANIRFSGSCANPAILKMLLSEDLPALNRIRMTGEVREAEGALGVENLKVEADAAHGLSVSAVGRFGLGESIGEAAVSDIAVNIKLSLPTTDVLKPYVNDLLPEMGPLTAQARLTGSPEQLSLEKIVVDAGVSGPLRVELKGDVGRIPLAANRSISEVKLSALFEAENTSALSTVLGISIPNLGPLKATGRINDRKGTIGINNVNISIGNEKSPTVKVTGTIASVLKAHEVSVEGIDLTVAATDAGLRPFFDLLGQPLPDLGLLNGSFRLTGNPVQLAVSKAKLSTVSPQGLVITAIGGVDRIRLASEKSLKGVNVSLSVTAPGLDALPGLADVDLPDLGSLEVTASVNDSSGSLDVETFDIRSGSDKNNFLRIQGQILRIEDRQQMALQATFEAASQPWVAKYMHQPEAVDSLLAGTIKITGTPEGVHIDEVRFGTAAGERLVFEARGDLTNLSKSFEVDLQLAATAPDPPAIGKMVGILLPPLSPLAINGRLHGNAQKTAFKGEVRIGETAITAMISAAFTTQRPRIDAMLAATSVNLENIGIYPEAPQETSIETAELESPKGKRLFTDAPLSFEALKVVDISFSLDIDKLVGRNIAIEDLDLDILLENGRVRIHPASLTYAAGFTSLEFTIDASGLTPEFILKVSGEDIDIDDVLVRAHEPVILSGALNLVADLHSSGNSALEIASNLTGEFSIALENGQIRRVINFLTLDAFDMLLTKADRRKYTDLNCLVNKIKFEAGVGTIEIFFMDSPRIRAKGAGNLNLAEETVDMIVNPEAKRKLFKKRSALRIHGPLTKPSVTMMPLSEAALLYSEILMPYVFLPARALGYLWSLIKNDKDATSCVFN